MFHWFGVVTNTKGDSLPNWQVECVQLADGVTVVPIYADENLTPILTASGIADRAKSDSSGNYDFFVPEGTYSLRFYDANGVFQRLQRYLPMYGNAPEAAIAAMEDAQAAQAAAEAAQAAAEVAAELAQSTAGGTVYATWADLAAATGMTAGDSAVVFEDAGTHTDPVVGGTVANAGIYIYSASPAGWERVADTEAVKAADSAVLSQAWAEGTLPGGAGTQSAKEWSEESALSAASAEAASGPTYASTAAGLAATTNGQAFAVDAGGGLVSVYLNSAGTAVLQRTLATTAALAASGGAALIGASGGGTVQGYIDGPVPSFTFANRPDPAGYLNKPGIIITDERYGVQPCYSDGTRWRRRSDGRAAQSAVISYYIDGTAGNDANAGTSASPIKTLTQLKTLVAALPAYRRSGLRFAFKRGTSIAGFWTLDANNFGCIFEAYSTSNIARPIFDCADTLVNANFTVDGSFANCYNITIAPNIETAPAEVPGIWVNGERFAYVASKTLCNAHPYTFTHGSAAGQTSLVLTVNPGSNPTSDGKVYEAAIRSHSISALAADECEFYDLHGKRPYGSYGVHVVGRYGRMDRCLSEDGNSHNFFGDIFSEFNDCEALNCNYGAIGSGTMFVAYNLAPTSNSTAVFRRCVARMTENTLKPKSAVTAVGLAAATTVTVTTGHGFVVGDHVAGESVGGATWLNGKRWYVSAVSGDQLTIQLHNYSTNRVAAYDSRSDAAWTSGGFIKLAPTAAANVIGFYNHGPGNGTDMWGHILYDRCEVHGCATTISAADIRSCVAIEPYCTQFSTGPSTAAYGNLTVIGGKHDNTPAVVGALSGKADGGSLTVEGGTYTINSTGYFQVSSAGTVLQLVDVRCEGFATLVRGFATNHVVTVRRCVNAANSNISQSNLYNFGAATTGLSVTSDFNDFGGYAGGFTIVGTAHANLAAYQAATGQDVNSKA